METWDAIRARRDVRQYTDQPIARENLERILEAGRRAPSSGNWQPWNFVVVTDREQLIELAKVWDQGGRHIAQLAATIALVAKGARGRAAPRLADVRLRPGNREHDAGRGRPRGSALAARRSSTRPGPAGLGIPRRLPAVYLIGLGYPADRPLRRSPGPTAGPSTRSAA